MKVKGLKTKVVKDRLNKVMVGREGKELVEEDLKELFNLRHVRLNALTFRTRRRGNSGNQIGKERISYYLRKNNTEDETDKLKLKQQVRDSETGERGDRGGNGVGERRKASNYVRECLVELDHVGRKKCMFSGFGFCLEWGIARGRKRGENEKSSREETL